MTNETVLPPHMRHRATESPLTRAFTERCAVHAAAHGGNINVAQEALTQLRDCTFIVTPMETFIPVEYTSEEHKYKFATQNWEVHKYVCDYVGADVSDYRFVVLHCWLGNVEMVRNLLDAGADVDGSVWDKQVPLVVAARACHVEVVELLLERGANPSSSEYMLGYPLMAAAAGGSLAIVRALLDYGAIADLRECSTLRYAVMNEHTAMVKLLFERFAPVEIETSNMALQSAKDNGLESTIHLLGDLDPRLV
ncbi:ankyrin repeat domain-containing protein 17 [Colletotrichum kahawae]|uniref:Ankyrin repeat domain-containing protein 17 n=1 Tax=Colletotrichum kahawae TaxID=34407 RepID=A0AAD9YFR8_COLKA|nr:ankyrin repeat domain-containing protein 17 [Colletotrichum kahawae]